PRRPPTSDRDWNKTLPAAQGNAQSWISEIARQTDAHSFFNELLDTPIDFSNFIMNWLDPRRPPTSDRDWNKTLPAAQGNAQSWISEIERQTDAHSFFNELLDTPIDFSNFIMNWLDVDTLTPELLAGPTYELMRGHPLPLILDNRGRRVIPFEHFINNDLEYLRGGASRYKYTTSVTKTKAADYRHIKWIEDLVVRNKMHKAFPLPGESSHWQYKFPLPVEGVPTAKKMEIPLPGVCTAMMKKLPVKDKWQLH
nr:hypothetical protein [Tanacetum cinerariifolium]